METYSSVNFEKILGRFSLEIATRRWDSVSEAWRSYAREINPVGSPPSITFSSLLDEGGIIVDGPPPRYTWLKARHPRSELPEAILNEGIFWLHKSVHVFGTAEVHCDQGFPTWSLSSAYQSAYFSARAIMAFFGISVGEMRGTSVLVDVCRDFRNFSRQKIASMGAFDEEAHISSLGVRFDHKQIWFLFQRLMRVSNCHLWQKDQMVFLHSVSIGDITKQRHKLHYDLTFWVCDDLHRLFCPPDFVAISPKGNGRDYFDRDGDNFTVALAWLMVQMATSLFSDIAKGCERLQNEVRLFADATNPERHPLFSDNFQRIMAIPELLAEI